MKLTDLTKKQKMTSTLTGESFDADISDPKVMMLIVRDKLYAHKLRTPIQEYIANAIDAQKVAHTDDTPIRIVLPTNLEPILKIRDFGTGMSEEKVKKTFSQYTASDKRENLDLIGGFGLGSKSAFAYTDKFTVSSYLNGMKYSYVAYAPSQLDLTFTQIAKGKTTEPNGVEIQIPIKPSDISSAIDAVTRMVILLPVCPEIVNYPVNFKKEVYEPFYKAILEETKDFCVFELDCIPARAKSALSLEQNNYFIRYNNIPYIIPNHYSHTFDRKTQERSRKRLAIMFKAPLNTFQIPPSRELLVEDDKYKKFIETQGLEAIKWNYSFRDKEQNLLQSITSLEEMQKTIKTLKFEFNPFEKNLTAHGHSLPCSIGSNVTYKINHSVMEASRYRGRYGYGGGKSTKFSIKVKHYHAATESRKEIYIPFSPSKESLLMICDDELDNLSLSNFNLLKQYFKNNEDVDSIILVKSNSPFAGIAMTSVSELKMPERARELPLYYTYGGKYDGSRDLTMGQTHFAGQIKYNYIEVPEGTKNYPMEDWILNKLTSGDQRLVFLPPETVKKLSSRKSFTKYFTKVDLKTFKNKDPREQLTEKELEIVKLINYNLYDTRESSYNRFVIKLIKYALEKNETIKNKWFMDLKKKIKIYNELKDKYELSLVESGFSYYSKPETQVKFETDRAKFIQEYPLLEPLRHTLNSGHNDKEIQNIFEYLKLVDHARKTGILKSE